MVSTRPARSVIVVSPGGLRRAEGRPTGSSSSRVLALHVAVAAAEGGSPRWAGGGVSALLLLLLHLTRLGVRTRRGAAERDATGARYEGTTKERKNLR